MSEREEFHYNQGVAPMMWMIFALSIVELIAVHLFVALKWPYIGWPLTILSAIGAVFILIWIRSFRQRPHVLGSKTLELNFGNLKSVCIALADIARVRSSLEQGALDKKDALNLAGIAYPNRSIELMRPVEKMRTRIFVRVDDPGAFDVALEARGVEVD